MKIITIIKYELIELSRDKVAWLIMVLLPIILTFILVNINSHRNAPQSDTGQTLAIGINLQDESELSKEFVNELKNSDLLEVTEAGIEELTNEVRDLKLIAGFILEKDFSRFVDKETNPEIGVLKLRAEAEYYAVLGEINAIFAKVVVEHKVRSAFAQTITQLNYINKSELLESINTVVRNTMSEDPIIKVDKIKEKGDIVDNQVDNSLHYIIGMIVMFVMFTVMTGAGVILKEKKQNTWSRLLSTPTGKSTILFGKMLGTFFCGWIQILLLILFGHYILGIHLGNSIPLTFLLFTVYMFSISGLGMFISTLIKSYAQLSPILTVTIICTSMLSGCYWPVWMMPDLMQKLARVFPQYWAIKALEVTIGKGSAIGSIILPLIILIGIGLCFFFLSVIISSIKLKSR